MSLHSICLVVAFVLLGAASASTQNFEWSRTYGGGGEDQGYSVCETSDGGFVIAGYTTEKSSDAYIMKTNSSGDTAWTRTLDGGGRDAVYSVIENRSGNYVIAGYLNQGDAGGDNVLLTEYDSDGKLLWGQTYDTSSNSDMGHCVQQTSDGGYIIAGETFVNENDWDILLIKTDPNGKKEWISLLGGSGEQAAFSVQQTSDGGFAIAGQNRPTAWSPSELLLLKVDKYGHYEWQKTYGGHSNDAGKSLLITQDNGYLVAGWTNFEEGAPGDEVYLVRTDKSGDTLWTRTYGGAKSDQGHSVCATDDGAFVVAGYSTPTWASDPYIYLLKINEKGDTLWTRGFGLTRDSRGYSVQQTSDGGYIIAGSTIPYGSETHDIFLVKVRRDLAKNLLVPSEYPTIQAALDTSIAGDTILVASGTHFGNGFRDLYWSNHWFVLKSEEGPENTIIDLGEGEGDRRFLYMDYYADYSRIVIEGFTFYNSYSMDGAGSVFYFDGAAPTVTDCVFDKNYGSAIYCMNANPTITDCRFVDNHTFSYGGAVYCYSSSSPTFTNCSFKGNSASYGGGAIFSTYYSYPEFNYCTFDDNSAAAYGGGAVMCGGWSDVALYYCTMVNNSGKYGGAVYLHEMGETGDISKQPDAMAAGRNGGNYIEHCIIAFGTEGGAVYRDPSTPSLYISCCDIYSNEGGDWVGDISGYLGVDGNICLDPQFCDAPAGNYMLMDTSPCVAANNSCGQMGTLGVGCQTLQLVVEPDALIFQADQGGANPPSQPLTIREIAGRDLGWTVYPDTASWLHLSTQEGTTPGTVLVNVHISGLPIDTFYSLLTFVSPEAVNSPVYLPVALTITEPEPVAAFTGSPLSGPAPLMVTFADLSTGGINTWHWDFGDGESSTDQHPVHTYTQPSLYVVTLVATGPYGSDTETKLNYINVSYAAPEAAFSVDTTSGEAPLTVQFTDQSAGNINTWHWDFGDGAYSEEPNPLHVYDTIGLYTVSLRVEGLGGEDTETKPDYIDVTKPNSPPEFVNPCLDAALVEGDPYHCLITADDPDEDPLTFTWNGIPAGAGFIDNNDGTADLSFTPDYSHVDLSHTAVFEITDGKITVPDTTIFTVTNRQLLAQVPTSDADHLITDKPIVIGFNEAIRESSLSGNVTITSAESDALTYSYDADRYQLLVNNSSDYLKELDMIVITLETGIRDSADYGIDQKYVDTLITGVGVYPGDANDDGGVDERDILPLGLYWNFEGPPRPDDSNLAWGMSAAHMFDEYHRWSPPASVYADCDGSGRIDASDICGVAANWSQTQGSARIHARSEMVASLAQVDQDVLQELYEALIDCPDGAGKESIGGMIESLLDRRQASLPTTAELYQNYPNPFNPQTVIRFFLPRSGRVNLSVYNIVGRKVSTLVDGRVSEGYTEVVWNGVDQSGRPVASGIYFYRIESENMNLTRRMMLLK